MSWTAHLTDATAVRRLFGGEPPALRHTRIHEVTVSRDGPRVTLRVDLPGYPIDPPAKWAQQGFNTVQVELVFVGANGISMEGFGRDPFADVEITRDDAVQLSVESPDFRLRLTAEAVLLSKLSAYMDE